RHVTCSIKAISQTKGFSNDTIRTTIIQHHERANGLGYPEGLAQEEIADYAKMVGLADTYEAMTHQRPHRVPCPPHQALREIIGPLKLFFDIRVIKALVNRISVYPVGSLVQLNSGEIAKVISSSPASPLRPFVLVILDAYKRHVSAPRTIDLCENNSFFIKGPALLDEKI
ncbi:MAG: hypothetical protein HQ595_03250, partial [Candidatus Omnitrophica bacterium]|nr:hypothetical protein [Candidatus Omnitrophota bacterium]